MKNKATSMAVCVMSVTLLGALLMGCGAGQRDTKQDISRNVPQETQQAAIEEVAETTDATENVLPAAKYEDNFAVDSEDAKRFAEKVKAVTAKKDLKGLAELTAFPVYVGLPGVGAVETKEAFLKLGADAVFTEKLMKSIEMADIDHLKPSMAGFSISDGGRANINFGVVNGMLAITGINYGS